MQSLEFQPNWVSPPGETISELLLERDLSLDCFIQQTGLPKSKARELLDGKLPVTNSLALSLQTLFSVSSDFWLRREDNYRKSLAALELKKREQESWMQSLPLPDLKKWGVIPKNASFVEQLKAVLTFFDVSDLIEWDSKYSSKQNMVAFRTSTSFDSCPMSVLTWLRQAEVVTANTECNSWNPSSLRQYLPKLRELTREPDQHIFLPKLREMLADSGVSLAIVRTPKGCSASGATFFPVPNRALIVLSFRYLTDDHFWFTLFHEIGHLLLHSNDRLFLEGMQCSESEEKEANEFAERVLVPLEFRDELLTFRRVSDWRSIMRFAKKIGISPGIVVGQLQHKELIHYSYLNNLKNKYKWAE